MKACRSPDITVAAVIGSCRTYGNLCVQSMIVECSCQGWTSDIDSICVCIWRHHKITCARQVSTCMHLLIADSFWRIKQCETVMFVQVTNPIQDENHFILNKDMVSEINTSVVCRTVVNRIIPAPWRPRRHAWPRRELNSSIVIKMSHVLFLDSSA